MRLAWIALALLVPARARADEPAVPAPSEPPAPPAPSTQPVPPDPAAPPAAAEAAGPPSTVAPRDPDDATDYRPQPMKRDIVIKVDRDRDGKNIAVLAGLAGLGAVLGGVGLYYNLDSRDAAAAVSPRHPTNQPWTAAQQADYDRAHSSGVKAGVFYGLGGALVIAAVVTMIATAPGSETTVIHPHYAIAPTPGGAVVGKVWSF